MKTPTRSASWTVALPAKPVQDVPLVTIKSAPHGPQRRTRARIVFFGNAAAVGFRCSLDGKPLSPCTSPRIYRGLHRTSHRFSVRAISSSGTLGPTASASWTIPVAVPTRPAAHTSGLPSWLIPLIVVAALIAGSLATLLVLRARRRAYWQLRAHGESPKRPCQEHGKYCVKANADLTPPWREVEYLQLHARNGDPQQELDRAVRGEVVANLNHALHEYRRHHDASELRTSVVPAADVLVQEIERWLRGDERHNDVSAQAHLIASKVKFDFTLYRCEKRHGGGPDWQLEDHWEASLSDQDELDVAQIQRSAGRDAEVESAVAQLAEFIEKVDMRPEAKLSARLSRTE